MKGGGNELEEEGVKEGVGGRSGSKNRKKWEGG